MSDPKLGRHRGRFCVTFYENGRRKRRSLGTRDPDEAKRLLAEFISIRERHAGDTIGVLYDRYAATKDIDRVRHAWLRLQPYFAPLLPDHINETTCKAYIAERRKRGASDGTIHTELVYLSAALNYAKKRGDIPRAPHIWKPQKPAPRDKCLTRDEAARLIDSATTPHVRLAIILMLGTAARIGAILDLTWDRVDFEKGMIRLTNPNITQTNKRRATVPMNNMVRIALDDARRGALTNYVIEWAGEPVKSIKRGFAQSCKKAGLIGVTPHVLRHSSACWMAEARVPIEEIAECLGHTDIRTTYRIYAKYRPEYLRAAVEVLEL